MCGGHHHRRGHRGYPNREQWVERLQSYREHLEGSRADAVGVGAELGYLPARARDAGR